MVGLLRLVDRVPERRGRLDRADLLEHPFPQLLRRLRRAGLLDGRRAELLAVGLRHELAQRAAVEAQRAAELGELLVLLDPPRVRLRGPRLPRADLRVGLVVVHDPVATAAIEATVIRLALDVPEEAEALVCAHTDTEF